MQKQHESYSAATAIKDIISSDEYLKMPRGAATYRAIADTALSLTGYTREQSDDVYRDEKALKQIVIGLMPSVYESQTELNLNRETMHPSEVGQHLDNVVEYNHALRELVDYNPRADFREIMTFVADTANVLYADPRDVEGIVGQTRARIDGMRHEVAAESMFWHFPGVVDVRSATREEDKRGIDVVVEYEDGETEGFDIKASEQSASEANQKSYYPKAVWSGLGWEDFHRKLRIDERDIGQYVPAFERQLSTLRSQQARWDQSNLAMTS